MLAFYGAIQQGLLSIQTNGRREASPLVVGSPSILGCSTRNTWRIWNCPPQKRTGMRGCGTASTRPSLTRTWSIAPVRTKRPWKLPRKPTCLSGADRGRYSGRSGWVSNPFVAAVPAPIGKPKARLGTANESRYRLHDPCEPPVRGRPASSTHPPALARRPSAPQIPGRFRQIARIGRVESLALDPILHRGEQFFSL